MRCPKCGHENRAQALFCRHCGQTLPDKVPAAAETACPPLAAEEQPLESVELVLPEQVAAGAAPEPQEQGSFGLELAVEAGPAAVPEKSPSAVSESEALPPVGEESPAFSAAEPVARPSGGEGPLYPAAESAAPSPDAAATVEPLSAESEPAEEESPSHPSGESIALEPAPPQAVEPPPLTPSPLAPVLLSAGQQLLDRYQVDQVSPAKTGLAAELVALYPHRRCWVCGSTENQEGDRFCRTCGADLYGQRYWLLPASSPVVQILVGSSIDLLPDMLGQLSLEGQHFLVCAEIPGMSLSANPLPFPLAEALRWGVELGASLAELHKLGLAGLPQDLDAYVLDASGQLRLRDLSQLDLVGASAEPVLQDIRVWTELLQIMLSGPYKLEKPSLPEEPWQEFLQAARMGVYARVSPLLDQLRRLVQQVLHPPHIQLFLGRATHTGRQRELNEDALQTLEWVQVQESQWTPWALYAVADGMGGHEGGEIASTLALHTLTSYVAAHVLMPSLQGDALVQEVSRYLLEGASAANQAVYQERLARGNDMGTTLTAALLNGSTAHVAHVGDSRAYLWHQQTLRPITRDHSLVASLVEAGHLDPAEIYSHPQRNVVLRSLGDKPEVEVDVLSQALQPGDALLLCSDGLWEMLRDVEMEEHLAAGGHPQEICDRLIEAANGEGRGMDNITVIIVQVGKSG
ncbi:MAG: protein phosphatase 2C domain-containing protein [Chloroflexia bacterium]|nr:protein phosphatase 2C domain-containing protein [Chloroflexia bacterium]